MHILAITSSANHFQFIAQHALGLWKETRAPMGNPVRIRRILPQNMQTWYRKTWITPPEDWTQDQDQGEDPAFNITMRFFYVNEFE